MRAHPPVLDERLLRLSARDYFSLRDACQGVSILGSIGSGKTSGSGQALAGAYLRAGMGGLILCAKPEEAELWRTYVKAHGRGESLVEFTSRSHGFNFLAYELARQGAGGLNSVVECLLRVLEAARMASPSPGRSGDNFWEDTTRQLLRNILPVLYAASGTVSIPGIINFVRSAPRSLEELQDPRWQDDSYMFETFAKARGNIDEATGGRLFYYWRDEYAALDPKTRGNIAISLTTALDRFNHGWLRQAFCNETTLVPELCFHGAIILLNMPALTLNEDGIIAQQLFKYMWQRAILARNSLAPEHRSRPVFLWADEAQYFVNSYDAEFLSTCRGSRACTVYLSQSLPTYYAKIGGDNARDRVHHLLGNFATKIFHSNGCPETNEWAAKTIGRAPQHRRNFSQNQGSNSSINLNQGRGTNRGTSGNSGGSNSPQGGFSHSWGSSSSQGSSESWGESRTRGDNEGTSWGYSEQMDYLIEPAQFGQMLRTGGPANANHVSAVWYQSGRTFGDSGMNILLTDFLQ
jgi:uncharacterized membrane protein YgcG